VDNLSKTSFSGEVTRSRVDAEGLYASRHEGPIIGQVLCSQAIAAAAAVVWPIRRGPDRVRTPFFDRFSAMWKSGEKTVGRVRSASRHSIFTGGRECPRPQPIARAPSGHEPMSFRP
jgi:hypothetical protein